MDTQPFVLTSGFLPVIIVAWLAFIGWTLFANSRRKRVLEEYERRRVELGAGRFRQTAVWGASGSAGTRAPNVFRTSAWEAIVSGALGVLFILAVIGPAIVTAFPVLGFLALVAAVNAIVYLSSRYRASANLVNRAVYAADAAQRTQLIEQALALDPDVIAAAARSSVAPAEAPAAAPESPATGVVPETDQQGDSFWAPAPSETPEETMWSQWDEQPIGEPVAPTGGSPSSSPPPPPPPTAPPWQPGAAMPGGGPDLPDMDAPIHPR